GSDTTSTAVKCAQMGDSCSKYSHCAKYQSPMSALNAANSHCARCGLPRSSMETAMASASAPQNNEVRVLRSMCDGCGEAGCGEAGCGEAGRRGAARGEAGCGQVGRGNTGRGNT